MKHRPLCVTLATAVALAVSPLAGPASADPPATFRDEFQQVPETGDFDVIRSEGKVTHLALSVDQLHSGALNGTSVNTFTCILVEGRDKFSCHGRATFTGTVAGVSGSGELQIRFTATCYQSTTVCTGRSRFHGAEDDALQGVHGTTRFTDSGFFPARSGTAEVQLHRH